VKRVFLAALAMTALVPNLAAARNRCGPAHLEECRNTNVLIWNPAFEAEIRKFLGNRRADYLYAGRPLVSKQMIDVLGGPPDGPRRIGDLWLFTACRAHSCQEKGAAVLEPKGGIIALAILHSACTWRRGEGDDCVSHDVLTTFVRSAVPDGVVKRVTDWAGDEVRRENDPAESLDRTEVIALR
jgi:hypothetical protein